VAIQRRVLQLKLAELGLVPNFKLIEQLRCSPDRRVNLWPGLLVSRTDTGALALEAERTQDFDSTELEVGLNEQEKKISFGGVELRWQFRVGEGPGRKPAKTARNFGFTLETFDSEKIGKKIRLRHWRAGDRFQPIGMQSAVKLQDLFTNAKIPRARRHNLVVGEAESAGIFWVEGLRIGEHYKLTPRTRQQLVWRWRRTAPAKAGKTNVLAGSPE
jgi:tRNA(Ile)-lysidine synthase